MLRRHFLEPGAVAMKRQRDDENRTVAGFALHRNLAAKKIQHERRLHRIRTAPKLPQTVKDW